MRRFALPLLIGLIGCDVSVPVPVSETVPVPVSAPVTMPVSEPTEGPPVPQDPVMMKRRSADWLAWNRRTLGDAYKKQGAKSPKWDEAAEKALELGARMFSLQTDPFTPAPEVHAAARKAVDAGSADPLVLYLYAMTSTDSNHPGKEEYLRRVNRAADALMASDYSPFRKGSAVLRAMQFKRWQTDEQSIPGPIQAIEGDLDRTFELFAESVKVDPRGEFWETLWYDNLRRVLSQSWQADEDFKTRFDKIDARLARVGGIEPLRLALKGRFLLDWAWEARTNAFASMVTEQQFQSFHDRLVEARQTLEAAHKLNPRQPTVARNMLTVALGEGGDRATMELWFQRALDLDPNDRHACLEKLNWLEPKWHGDPEGREMLAFGRACAATGNWIGEIALVQADAMIDYAACNLTGAEILPFFGRPENWTLNSQVFEEYLKHYPTDYAVLSKYAHLAYMSGQIQIAHEQFNRVGDHLTRWPENSSPTIESLRQARDIVAKAAGSFPKSSPSMK